MDLYVNVAQYTKHRFQRVLRILLHKPKSTFDMPTPLTSPPLPRQGRSPSKRRSMQNMTPPVPAWDTAATSTPPVPVRERVSHSMRKKLTWKRERHLYTPQAPIDSPSSPRLPTRAAYDVTSPRLRSSPRPALMSPPIIAPVSPATRRQKLLPAIPLEVDIQSTPRSRRSVQVNGYEGDSNVQIVVNGGVSPPPVVSPALRERRSSMSLRRDCTKPAPTPPRPARRRRDSNVSPRQTDLLPPRPDYSRSSSPCDSTTSTISDAPTPRATPRAIVAEETRSSSKRDSTQRRLDALRGLVANLDFNQPWSLTEEINFGASSEGPCEIYPDVQETLVSPATKPFQSEQTQSSLYRSPSTSSIRISKPLPLPERVVSQDHGWEARTPPKSRFSRSESNLNTPIRMRQETFDVASSGYSKCLEPAAPMAPPTPETTWRSSLSTDLIYQRLMKTRGADEIKRQEVMWEMCETEQAFLKSMRNVLRLFATPLKTPQGKWIEGIPKRISQLFDSLESVAHAHSIICATQRDIRRKAEVVDINAFVRCFKAWIPKLEVYEWYLLRFEPVVASVEDHIRDSESVFGEFVRMQLKEESLGSMSLGSMLLKPVQRLMKYPLFLKVSSAESYKTHLTAFIGCYSRPSRVTLPAREYGVNDSQSPSR